MHSILYGCGSGEKRYIIIENIREVLSDEL